MRGFGRLTGAFLFLGTMLVGACGDAELTNDPGNGGCRGFVANGGDTIPDPPDGASLCPTANSCNYQSQTGCAAGTSCRPGLLQNTEDITSFCDTAGDGGDDAPCNENADCAVGYVCPEDGRCHQLCCGRDWSESTCSPGYSCYREFRFRLPGSGDIVPTGAYVCDAVGCDVFTSDECSSDEDCKIIDPVGTTACVPPTAGEEGDPCSGATVCGRGLSCVGDPGEQTCRRLCRAEECGAPGCPSGQTCVRFNRDPEGVGECTPGWDAP